MLRSADRGHNEHTSRMEDYGLVSIITPTYNCARFIGDTIESILAQSYPNWELLVTDDCSTDDTCAAVEKYAARDPRIRLFRLPENSGAGIARNNSIREARGRFIAFCDSDDRWYPDKLAKQLAFMTARDCALSYTSYMSCNEEGETVGIVVCRSRETLGSMMRNNRIGCLTAVYDTAKVGKIFMPELRKRQDWGLLLRILKKCGVAYGMKEPLALYRVRSMSLSRNKADLVKYNLAVYRHVLGWNAVRARFFFAFVFMPSYVWGKLITGYMNR